MDKSAKTSIPVHDLIQNRWSPRSLTGDPVDTETLTRIFEAARWAPSSRNQQPWRFILVTRDDGDDYQRTFECLGQGNQEWAKSAYALVVVTTQTPDPDKPVPISFYDAGLAVSQLTLEALNNELYLHQMGGIDRDRIREVCEVPDDQVPIVVLAVGRLGRIEDLSESARQKDLNPRERRPLDETVFRGQYGRSARMG
jgi:nitroreductase